MRSPADDKSCAERAVISAAGQRQQICGRQNAAFRYPKSLRFSNDGALLFERYRRRFLDIETRIGEAEHDRAVSLLRRHGRAGLETRAGGEQQEGGG